MAVTRDATGAGGTTTGAACTAPHTIGTAGPTTVVVALVAISVSSNSTATTCSATYGGTAMTQLGLTLLGSSTNRSAYGIYYLFNPASGAQNCVVTPAGASTKAGVRVSTVSYTGVGDLGTMQSTAALTVAATSVANGYNVFGHINGAALTTPSQSQRVLLGSAVSGVGDFLLVQDAAGTGSNITFSVAGTATTPSTFGVALEEASPAGYVAFDALGAGANATTSPISWSHTCSGADRAVFVIFTWVGTGGTYTGSSVTYDGVPMTQLAAGSINGQCEVYGLLDPPTGPKTIVVTGSGTTTRMKGTSVSYTGVDSFETTVTANTPLPATMSATAAVGGRIFQAFFSGLGGTSWTAYNQKQRYVDVSSVPAFVFGDAAGTGSSTTFTATSNASSNFRGYAVPMVQASAGTPAPVAFTGSGDLTATATLEYDRTASLTGTGTLSATISQIYALPKTESLTDGFGTEDPAKWDGFDAFVTVSGGQLSIIPDSSFSRDVISHNRFDFTGSYVLMEVAQLGSAGVVTLTLQYGGGSFVIFTQYGPLIMREQIASSDETQITYDPVAHRWWRMRESGGTIYWETSPDGANWTIRRSKTWAVPSITTMEIYINTHAVSGTTPVLIDNFNLPTSNAIALSGSGTLSATATRLHPMSASPTGSGSLSATATRLHPMTANTAGTGDLIATTVKVAPVTADPTGSGTLTATATRLHPMSAALTGTGAPSAIVGPALNPALAGSGSLTATAMRLHPMSAALVGSGTLTATATRLHPMTASLTADGTLSATVEAVVVEGQAAPALAGNGTLTATATRQHPMTASLSGSGTLSATRSQVYAHTPPLGGSGALGAAVTARYTRVANPSGAGALSATVRQIYPVSATLLGAGGLTATTALPGLTSAALAGSGALTAAIAQIYLTTPALNGSGALTATANPNATPALAGSGSLSATVAPIIAAALRGTGALNAAVIGAAVTAAGYASTGTLTATITQTYRTAPSLEGSGALTATVQVVIDVMQAYPDAIFVVRPETFVVTVTAEISTVTVKAENAVAAVKAETRTVTVKEESDTLTMKPESHSLAVAR